MTGGTAVVSDARMLAHDPGRSHPERADRLRVLLDHLEDAPGLVRLHPRLATEDELALVHTRAHIERVARTAGRPRVVFDPDTSASADSYEAARLAAGSLLVGCEAILAGEVANAFALVRPPGHHAERERAMGFCLFNNIAVAAAAAIARGLSRVAIVDIDVHHGNGTQWMFYDDSRVLYISTHQFPFYPGTGAASEAGRGEGEGFTVNVPLEAGALDADYAMAYMSIASVLEQYVPALLLISAGYDAHADDPLASMRVSTAGYAAVMSILKGAAARSRSPIALVTEGGYDLAALRGCLGATFAVLASQHRPVATAFDRPAAPRGARGLEATRAVHAPFWRG